MTKKYVLGVDGGNSKTDYLLHDLDGRLVKHMRAGTCSHERLGMQGAGEEMEACAARLLREAGVDRAEVAAAAFGLAGVDQAVQKRELERIVRDMRFENSIVMNDSFLGIKAGSETGVGVSSINGTGTASGGIDSRGKWVQVGGHGGPSGDDAGGGYIAGATLRAAYDAAYRMGRETLLLERVCALFGCGADTLHDEISIQYLDGRKVTTLDILNVFFAACDEKDGEALRIVRHVADSLARSAAGCARRLVFDSVVPLVLIGSVWTKRRYPLMIEHFKGQFEQYTEKEAAIHILQVPPAAGSVLWALELAEGMVPEDKVRRRVVEDTKGL